MLTATALKVDFEVGAAYVTYRAGVPTVSSTRLNEDVIVHYDAQGTVVGIELIDLRADAVESAALFARQNGLDFPTMQSLARDTIRIKHDVIVKDTNIENGSIGHDERRV